MKKGKKLLVLLMAALMIAAACCVTSFAANSNEDSYSESMVGSAKLTAADAFYDGSEHGAVLDDNITGSRPDEYDVTPYVEGHRPYGEVSKVYYYKSADDGTRGAEISTAPVDAGTYFAAVTISIHTYEGSAYTTTTHELSVKYQIKKAKLDVVWDDAKLVYNGEPQFPAASANGVSGEKIELTTEPVDSTADPCVDAGEHTAKAALSEADAANYTLNETGATKHYTIEKCPVELKWYRPVYDEYGIPVEGEYQAVDEDTMIKLVYNGQSQSPIAKIDNVQGDDSDKVRVVSEGEAVNANTYNPNKTYIAKAVGLSGSRSKNYSFENETREFQIVPRPVKLRWGYYPGEREDAVYATVVKKDADENDYITTYNGVRQDAFVEVMNPGIDEDNYTDDITIDTVNVDDCKRFSILGGDIEEDRIFTDAGIYDLTPGALSDSRNYTFNTLNYNDGEEADGDITVNSDKKVDDYNATYTIEQYLIKKFDWDEDSLTKVYNASYQEPEVSVSAEDLQGPDTDEEVFVIPWPAEYDDAPVNVGSYEFNVMDIYYVGDVDRSMNYTFKKTHPNQTQNLEATMTITPAPLTITANDNSVTYGMPPADKGVRYSGLKNGNDKGRERLNAAVKEHILARAQERLDNNDINQGEYDALENNLEIMFKTPYNVDDENGEPTVHPTYANSNNESLGVFVKQGLDAQDEEVPADEAIGIRHTYAQNGKPGSYAIVPYLKSGYSAPNYNIKFVNGTLNVNDKVSTLVAKGTKKGSKGVKISWNSVTGAASYDVYAAKCNTKGRKRSPKYVATVSGNSYKLKKLNGKKLQKNTCYKYYVVAKNAAGAPIATSLEGHFITGNVKGKTVNAKSMAVNTASVSVGKGGTAQLSASYKKAKAGKKYKLNNNAHSALTRFVSENPAVATVDANGIVRGVGTGWCRVYVQGVTGMWTVVEVNVK